MTMEQKKTKWDIWLNVLNTIVLICVIPWGVWVTRSVMACEAFRNVGPRLTAKDIDYAKMELREWTVSNVTEKLNKMNESMMELRIMFQKHLDEKTKP